MRNSEAMAPKPYLPLTGLVYNMNYEVKIFLKIQGATNMCQCSVSWFLFFKKNKETRK